MSACSQCALRAGCTRVVPGAGSAEAEIMFIGEAPGKKEDELGVPFVGAAGKFLDEMLASIKLKCEDVYIANVVRRKIAIHLRKKSPPVGHGSYNRSESSNRN